MLLQPCVAIAIEHELTQSAIRVAVQKVRGRVGSRRIEYDVQFESRFRAFAEKVSALALAPVCDDLSRVGSHEDWRQAFADGTLERMRSTFGLSFLRCFPVLAAAKPKMDLDAFVSHFAREIWREMIDAAPEIGFVRDALWHLLNVTAQVSRCVSGDLDPMLLIDPSLYAPLPRPAPKITKPFPRPYPPQPREEDLN